MKGVILGIAPNVRIVDHTHAITPQGLVEATVRMDAAIDYFPEGTIHLVVVDPGVGTQRAAIIVKTRAALFVAPDNGVLTLPLRRFAPETIVEIDTAYAAQYLPKEISATFHGRDVFAPIAAHLAAGVDAEAFGRTRASLQTVEVPLTAPRPIVGKAYKTGIEAHTIYVDRFGNLVTDLTLEYWNGWRNQLQLDDEIEIRAGNRRWRGLAPTYGEVKTGDPLAYWGSSGRLEVAIRDGSAAGTLALGAGSPVLVYIPELEQQLTQ